MVAEGEFSSFPGAGSTHYFLTTPHGQMKESRAPPLLVASPSELQMGKSNCRYPPLILAMLVLHLLVLFPTLQPCSAAVDKDDVEWGGKKGVKYPPYRQDSVSPLWSGKTSLTVFPLVGDVYPSGVYYVEMVVGNPPKPYYLDIDTGSDLTWFHCDAPCVSCPKCPHPWYKPKRNQLVPCEDPLCVALQDSLPVSSSLSTTATSMLAVDEGRCTRPSDQCDYEIEYADHGSSLGVLVTDAFTLRLTSGSYAYPSLAFGCGYDQHTTTIRASLTDGVLGLGPGRPGVLGQLRGLGLVRSVVGQCLGRQGGGFMFLGDTLIPQSGMTWTPMSVRGRFRKYYAPGPATLLLGKQPLVPRDFQVVFDSGSSYTYFASHSYELFLNKLIKDLIGMPLKVAPEDPTLPLCWKGNKPFRSLSEVRKYFSSLLLAFPTGRKVAAMEIPPEGYLIITKYGNACLGILNGTQAGLQDLNLIGDISMQDQLFVYDNEQERIGWTRANCDKNAYAGGEDVHYEGQSCEDVFSKPLSSHMGILELQN